jgi:AbrB family looped-hinge helix DNA binding protein
MGHDVPFDRIFRLASLDSNFCIVFEYSFRHNPDCIAIRLEWPDVRRYLTNMVTKISTKGQLVIPAALREQDKIEPGQEFEIERIDQGEYRLKRKSKRRNEGLVDLLLSCPVKGWFRPLDRSERTDSLQLPDIG